MNDEMTILGNYLATYYPSSESTRQSSQLLPSTITLQLSYDSTCDVYLITIVNDTNDFLRIKRETKIMSYRRNCITDISATKIEYFQNPFPSLLFFFLTTVNGEFQEREQALFSFLTSSCLHKL